ncbi:hypothetical protein EPUS_02673 [Endocarpon pusillum Z07020]|uniref:Uncharacterized protein n=1 Tax=Endocarpon pusillum (strain Z07020 / HMAS-L-300199) TaxID=1263415 RepID=U1GXU9_ENDPU|nr:uncharacterized protein EPUS_02673 [Endocarpon pusillum Z07020]ERF76961.1 hypothetical protein EPUS_02673 [Endocarpon pusillum Z07020]
MPTSRPKAILDDDLPPKETLLHLSIGRIHFQIDWLSWCFKALAFSALAVYLFSAWWLFSPWSPAWSSQNTMIPGVGHEALEEYFHTFSGNTECGIGLADLYVPPQKDDNGKYARGAFCPNREKLLEAMTGGGRHGFDAPYYPKGCHYRWYSVAEICMILERFDSLVFIGDDTLQPIYSGLNMLLRQDLALGSLDPSSELSPSELSTTCRCDNQFIKDTCAKHALTSSDQVALSSNNNNQNQNPYLCSRTPHAFLSISGSPFDLSTLKSLRARIPRAPASNYHPIPIITSLTPPSTGNDNAPSATLATQTLSALLSFADATARKTPILWLNPPATGHLDISGSGKQRNGNNNNNYNSNNDLWMFSEEMQRVAREKDVEVLGLWNMTVQASSWDGRRFGSSVALVQAMMVLNWLSRLESS